MKMQKIFNRYAAISAVIAAIAFTLSGCGGGGGGGGGGSNSCPACNTNTGTTVDQYVAIITSPPAAPTYANEELAIYTMINAARTQCGFGYLSQNSSLDTAARAHNLYMAENDSTAHSETLGNPGYTGSTYLLRELAAGYPGLSAGSTEDEINFYGTSNKTGFGTIAATAWLTAPYHLRATMIGAREFGISVFSTDHTGTADYVNPTGPIGLASSVDFGTTATLLPQQQSSSAILTYPCQGVTNTGYKLTNESPSPVPGRDFSTNPIGQPIFIQAAPGVQLVITSVAVTGPAGSVALLPTMTSANDPNYDLNANQAFIIPSDPLLPNTTYSVTITGTSNGTAFTKINFSFTTGSIAT